MNCIFAQFRQRLNLTCFYLHIRYCCELLRNTYETNIKLQKIVFRTITQNYNTDYLPNTSYSFVTFGILKLKDITVYLSYILTAIS